MSLEWLVVAALRGAALLLLPGLLVRTVSRDPASLRHLAWTLALAGALVVPFGADLVPWRLPIVPSTVVSPPAFERASGELTPALDAAPSAREETLGLPRESADSPPATASAAAGPGVTTRIIDAIRRMAPIIWLAGALALVLRVVAGFFTVRGITRRARPLETAEWEELLEDSAARMGVYPVPALLMSDEVALPCTAGWRRPVIILPDTADEWTPDRCHVVLLHEMAHVRRRDILAHLVAQAACALHWFNPLAWSAARRLRSEAERACDDLVVDAGARPSDYAAHLLEIVRGSAARRVPVPVLPLAQRSEFEGRLLSILEYRGGSMPAPRASWITAGLVVAAIVPIASLGAARPAVPASPNEPAAEVTQTPEPLDAPAAPRALVESPGAKQPQRPAAANANVAALIEALRDEVPEVRAAAVEALGEQRDTATVSALMEVLRRDADPAVRRSAAWALGQIEDPRAIPALADALRGDADAEVRRNAAWALGEIEDKRGTAPLVEALRRGGDAALRKTIVEALGMIEDPASVPGLTPMLRDSDPVLRQAAAEALGQIEDTRSVDDLMPLVRDEVVGVRRAAVDALGQIEDRRALPALARALGDADVEVRRSAAQAIGDLDELHQAPPELILALGDTDAEVRHNAIQALGNIEDPAGVAPLVALLRDPDVEIRRAVVEALDDIDDPAVTAAMRQALRDEDPEIRRMAAKALGNRR